MDIKKIVGAVVGTVVAIGGAAILFNKKDDDGNIIEEK